MAKDILGVQPMTVKTGEILSIRNDGKAWSNWRKTTSIWPRRSIDGKIIFGRINKRDRTSWEGNSNPNTSGIAFNKIRIHEFATDKELFKAKLEGRK